MNAELTREQVRAMCDDAKYHTRRSIDHSMLGGTIMMTNIVLILVLHSLWPSCILIPVSALFLLSGSREDRRAQKIMDVLKREIMRE